MSYLIKDTTEEERRKIVEESLGNLSGACDGCSQRVADMYDAYIRGEMEAPWRGSLAHPARCKTGLVPCGFLRLVPGAACHVTLFTR